MEGGNESRRIAGAKEIGENLKSETHCDVVSLQLGRNARAEEIEDFGKNNCSRFAPSADTWTAENESFRRAKRKNQLELAEDDTDLQSA
ncbi:UNVERIFIED_CONTAM: hypothetical protein Sindi_0174500 [Sesamum indicum]